MVKNTSGPWVKQTAERKKKVSWQKDGEKFKVKGEHYLGCDLDIMTNNGHAFPELRPRVGSDSWEGVQVIGWMGSDVTGFSICEATSH